MYVETSLLLHARGHRPAALALGRSLASGELGLATPTGPEHVAALDLIERFADQGIDLPDACVAAMAHRRGAPVLTWDFRHFRTIAFGRGQTLPLFVTESDLAGI